MGKQIYFLHPVLQPLEIFVTWLYVGVPQKILEI